MKHFAYYPKVKVTLNSNNILKVKISCLLHNLQISAGKFSAKLGTNDAHYNTTYRVQQPGCYPDGQGHSLKVKFCDHSAKEQSPYQCVSMKGNKQFEIIRQGKEFVYKSSFLKNLPSFS